MGPESCRGVCGFSGQWSLATVASTVDNAVSLGWMNPTCLVSTQVSTDFSCCEYTDDSVPSPESDRETLETGRPAETPPVTSKLAAGPRTHRLSLTLSFHLEAPLAIHFTQPIFFL